METKAAQGNILVVYANYRDERRGVGLKLAPPHRSHVESAVRNLVGRANRHLVGSERLRYKAHGPKGFDLGAGDHGSDPAKLPLNDFKRGLGGQILREYECEQVPSLKGRVLLAVRTALNWAKSGAATLRLASRRRRLEGAAVHATAGA